MRKYLSQDKRNFESKVIKTQRGCYITLKKSIHQHDRAVLNIHTSNTGAPIYTNQWLTAWEGRQSDFSNGRHHWFSAARQKINRKIFALNNTMHSGNILQTIPDAGPQNDCLDNRQQIDTPAIDWKEIFAHYTNMSSVCKEFNTK